MGDGYSTAQVLKAKAQFQLAADLLEVGLEPDQDMTSMVGQALQEADDAYTILDLSSPAEKE